MKSFTTFIIWGLLSHLCCHSTFAAIYMKHDTIQFGGHYIVLPKSQWAILHQRAEQFKYEYDNCKSCKDFLPFVEMALPLIEEILVKNDLPREMKYLAFFQTPTFTNDKQLLKEGLWQLRDNFFEDLGLKNPNHKKVDERWSITETTEKVVRFFKRDDAFFQNHLLSMASLELSLNKLKEDLVEKDPNFYVKFAGKKFFYFDKETDTSYINFINRYLAFSLFVERLMAEKAVNFRFVAIKLPLGISIQKYMRENVKKEDKENFKKDNLWIKKITNKLPDDKIYDAVVRQEAQTYYEFFVLDKYNLYMKYKDEKNPKKPEPKQNESPKREEEEQTKNQQETKEQEISSDDVASSTKGEEAPPETLPIPAKKETKKVFHVVQKGETLYSLSKAYKEPVHSLRDKNKIKDINKIHIKQILLIREELPNRSQKGYFYKISKEKKLENLAKMFDISIEQLCEWNYIKNTATFSEGQIIKVSENNFCQSKTIKKYKFFLFNYYSNRHLEPNKKRYFLKNNIKIMRNFSKKSFFFKTKKNNIKIIFIKKKIFVTLPK
ncbi:MAG: LysM peptidoglycan-binding domain-containing protein [Bacteroidetes bacterium]|nr:MAG: LysM peptidoglycan-binding domain-containing protein [Bacteroidota bacterium]TAG89578.1 MAG: LysM peptidoglycan-binding domain-containing protein [Bacteroidota bacterium]